MVRSIMSFSSLHISIWGYALSTMTFLLNLAPSKLVSLNSLEMWKGIKLELESNEVCDFVEAPKGIKPISCK